MRTTVKMASSEPCQRWLPLLLIVLLSGCARTLMQTPDVYVNTSTPLFDELPPELQGNVMEILYVTDRLPESNASGTGVFYGDDRSTSLILGVAEVQIEHGSSPQNTDFRPRIELKSTRELVRFPPTPYPFSVEENGQIKIDPKVAAELERTREQARREIVRRLALTPKKEVLVLVHGVAVSFEEAVLDQAESWHFLGREGVPIAYTWPAGGRGLFFYTIDRESGEFTLLHLKQFLRFLIDLPEIERIHLLAHSRGTDVVLTALRELIIEVRAAGMNPRERLKIENVVLVAADIDLEVALQRLVGEAMSPAVGRMTFYTNARDEALSASISLFASRQRLGTLTRSDFSEAEWEVVKRTTNVDLIVYEGSGGGFFQHAYYDEPAVSSDIFMLLRFGLRPGEGKRRGLERVDANVWRIGG